MHDKITIGTAIRAEYEQNKKIIGKEWEQKRNRIETARGHTRNKIRTD